MTNAAVEQERVAIRLRRLQEARRPKPKKTSYQPMPVNCVRCGGTGLLPGQTTLLCRCQGGRRR